MGLSDRIKKRMQNPKLLDNFAKAVSKKVSIDVKSTIKNSKSDKKHE